MTKKNWAQRFIYFSLLAITCGVLALPASAQQKVTVSVTVTNLSTNGMTFVLNGSTRIFTNLVSDTASQVATNSDVTGNGSKTNLLTQIYGSPFTQVLAVDVNSNSFSLIGNANLTMSASISAGLGKISYSTQTVASVIALQGPVSSLPTANARTNVASDIVGGINAPENTNQIIQGSIAASQLMGTSNSQTIYAIKLFTNAAGQFWGIISNSPAISGTVIALAGGVLTGCTNVNPVITNGVNYGNAFSSPGTNGTGAENFGLGAAAQGDNSLAVGKGALASSLDTTALGFGALATGITSTSVGQGTVAAGFQSSTFGAGSIASGTNSTAIGTGADATGYNSTALGEESVAGFDNSTAVGTGANTTSTNQVMLGAPDSSTVVPKNLSVGNYLLVSGNASITGLTTNQTWIGTNNFTANSDIAFAWKTVSSLASGNNAAVPIGTNEAVKLSGPTGNYNVNGIYAAGAQRDGKDLLLWNNTIYTMTLANQSGVDPAPANRIVNPNGADITCPSNTIVSLRYDGSSSRWILVNAGTVATVTNVSASQITGSIQATNIYSAITQTNFVLNQLYTNVTGGAISLHATASLTTAAVAGSSQMDLMVAQTGSTFTAIDSAKVITGVSALTGAYLFGINASVQTNGIYYFTNSSAGAGDSSSIVSGSGQVTGL